MGAAGAGASIPDEEYQAAGASIVTDPGELYGQSQIVLKVRAPEAAELALMRKDAVLIGLLSPHQTEGIQTLATHGITAFSMEKLPRISRAQSMDVLSSQANIAGYKAVMLAANAYQRFMPMLMTAAGTVKAARVLVLGAGTIGLGAALLREASAVLGVDIETGGEIVTYEDWRQFPSGGSILRGNWRACDRARDRPAPPVAIPARDGDRSEFNRFLRSLARVNSNSSLRHGITAQGGAIHTLDQFRHFATR